jgi:hypothetical protein
VQTDFRAIYMPTVDSNTICITDIEQGILVTVWVVWVLAVGFVMLTVRSEFMKNI